MKRGPGRPSLDGTQRHAVPIVIRLPRDTVAALDAEARRRGIPRSELLRELLLPGVLEIVTGGDRD